jgi:hypothetical protein
MAVYRFRVAFEDNEDVSRDIEIKSNQTFADFHKAIQEAIKFDNKHAASFFVSDDYWRKEQEITLLPEDLDTDVKLMEKTKISTLIENPYQRFIYIYDKAVQWTMLVELIKIIAEDPKVKYPICSKSIGTAPKQYKTVKPVEEVAVNPDNAAMAKLLEEMEDSEDDEAYKHANEETHDVEEEDIKLMEGEEGDEDHEGEEGEEEGEGEEHGYDEEHDEH